MTYSEAISYIHSLERFGIQPGLSRVQAICEALGNPQRCLRVIHVAGTNGKGSTSTMIANVARAAGQTVGLYISPFVVEFRERMQVNGEMILENELTELVETVKYFSEKKNILLSEFEFITALAFFWFLERACDLVVLEVGMGGRWDATNVIEQPLCSVITKISLDHTKILGKTIQKIAEEKCGIIKEGVPVVVSCEQPEEAISVIRAHCDAKKAPFLAIRKSNCEIHQLNLNGSRFSFKSKEMQLSMIGEHMCYNALMAIEVSEFLKIPENFVKIGLETTRMPARMEMISENPFVLLDGGHNPDAASAIVSLLRQNFHHKKVNILFGMMKDKDIFKFLEILKPFCGKLILLELQHPRAATVTMLEDIAQKIGYSSIFSCVDVALALEECDTPLLVCGSFLLGSLRNSLKKWSASR